MDIIEEIKLTLSDSDVISMDESTGDIKLSRDIFPEELSIGDVVKIHFKEDSDNITHVYHVENMHDLENTVELVWEKQVNTTLTEANPLNIFKKKTGDELVSRNIKKSEKQDKKDALKGERLVARDMSPEAKDNMFYLQNPDGSYQKGIRQSEAKSIYTKLGTKHPSIANAVVLTPMNYIYRKGMQDFRNTGESLDPKDLTKVKLLPSFSKEWPEKDIKEYEETKASQRAAQERQEQDALRKQKRKEYAKAYREKKKAELARETTDDTTKKGEAAMQDSDATKKETKTDPYVDQNKGVTKPIIDKFRKIAMATGLEVFDAFGKPVNMDSSIAVGKITPETLVDYKVKIKGKEFNLTDWLTHAVKTKVITESCDEESILLENLLFESPVVRLDDEDLIEPQDFSIKNVIKRAETREAEKIARLSREAAEAELKKVYDVVMPKFNASIKRGDLAIKTLEVLFDELVPPAGPAASVAGEIVRAMMRLVYRDYNDGDRFFEGYGIETCASSAEYLADNGLSVEIQSILDDAMYYSNNDESYTQALDRLVSKVIDLIKNNNSLIYTINEEDSRDYSVEYIEEHQPTYELDINGSDDIINLVENGTLTAWDLNDYVEQILSYEQYFDGAEVERPWNHDSTNVTVSNLTRDGYDELYDRVSRNLDGFWQDLVDEHADDLTNDYDDEYDAEEDEDEEDE